MISLGFQDFERLVFETPIALEILLDVLCPGSRQSNLWVQIQFCVFLFYVVYSMKWTHRSWLHTRGVSYREMWWQWHYEAAQSLLTFDSRNDVWIPWRQNWSNSGSAFFKIRRIKFTLNFEITQTVIMVLRTDLRLTAVKRQPSSLFFDKTCSNQVQL